MSGKPSSSPSSPSAGSAGFSGLVRGLRQGWRRALLRFALGLVGASLAWLLIAPAYAWGLAGIARLAAPALERTPGTRYAAEASRVVAHRPVGLPGERSPRKGVYTLWTAEANFAIPLFVALVLATPGWSLGMRVRALGWGLGALTLVQVASLLVTNEFWQQMPVRAPDGRLGHLSGHSAPALKIATALYYFFEIMRGFFPLVVYFALLALPGRPPARAPIAAAPRGRCPCGSGRRYKRCCGAPGRPPRALER
jgi:hypothetical protein